MAATPRDRGDRIRYARQLRGWNQQELADAVTAAGGKAGKTRIHDWETGTKPRGDSISFLAAALDTTASWILSGEGDPPGAEGAAGGPSRSEFDALTARVTAIERLIATTGEVRTAGQEEWHRLADEQTDGDD